MGHSHLLLLVVLSAAALFVAGLLYYFRILGKVSAVRSKARSVLGRMTDRSEWRNSREIDLGRLEGDSEQPGTHSATSGMSRSLARQLTTIESILTKTGQLADGRAKPDLYQQVLSSKKQLEAVFDVVKDTMFIVDRNHSICRINRACQETVGADFDGVLGRTCREVFSVVGELCDRCPADETFRSGRSTSTRFDVHPSGGESRALEYITYPVLEGAAVDYVVCQLRDVTEERNLALQLARANTLASIGTMTAGIAHEINNPLSGISGCAENMLSRPERYGLNPKGQQRIRSILDSATQAQRIIRGLLDLSRKNEGVLVVSNIVPIVESAFEMVHLPGYDSIEKKLQVDNADGYAIRCNKSQIQQVLVNLITNAAMAVIDRMQTVGESGEACYSPWIACELSGDTSNVYCRIVDNGVGVAEENMGRIFDPFFTTRDPGEGTGLGLAICNKIMIEHEGSIAVKNRDGHTCFTLMFRGAH